MSEFSDPLTAQIVAFLREVGLSVTAASLAADTFLPGILMEAGGLLVDESRLRYPGDLLHEAGHLAVVEATERATMGGNLNAPQGDEMAAMAWSYAAAVHLGLPPEVVFHAEGYRGTSGALIAMYTGEREPKVAVPLLQAYEMTYERRSAPADTRPYPHMLRWLR